MINAFKTFILSSYSFAHLFAFMVLKTATLAAATRIAMPPSISHFLPPMSSPSPWSPLGTQLSLSSYFLGVDSLIFVSFLSSRKISENNFVRSAFCCFDDWLNSAFRSEKSQLNISSPHSLICGTVVLNKSLSSTWSLVSSPLRSA